METFLVSSAVAHNVVGCLLPWISDEFHQRNNTRHSDKKGRENVLINLKIFISSLFGPEKKKEKLEQRRKYVLDGKDK